MSREIVNAATARARIAGRTADERLGRLFEQLLADIAALLVREPTGKIEDVLMDAFEQLADVLECDRVLVGVVENENGLGFDPETGSGSARVLHSWHKPGCEPELSDMDLGPYPYSMDKIRKGEAFCFARLDDLPPEAAPEKEFFAERRIRSHLTMPMQVEGSVVGATCFSQFENERDWPDETLRRLTIFSDLFAGVLSRADAVRRLAESEERYRSFVTNSSETIWRVDFDEPVPLDLPEDEQIERLYRHGRILECNDAFAAFYGYDSAEKMLAEKPWTYADCMPRDNPACLAIHRQTVRAGFRVTNFDTVELDRHGNEKIAVNSCYPEVVDGAMVRLWGTARDVTEERRKEREIERLRDELAATIDSLPEQIAVLDGQGRIVRVNRAWREAALAEWGTAKLAAQVVDYFATIRKAAEDGDPYAARALSGCEAVLRGEATHFDLEYQGPGPKRQSWFNLHVTPLRGAGEGLVVRRQDLTERKAREEAVRRQRDQIAHLSRSAEMGRITGALAHELNQPLTAIRANAQAAQHQLERESPDTEEIGEILTDIIHDEQWAAEVVRRTRSMLERRPAEPERMDLAEVIAEVAEMTETEAVIKGVQLSWELPPEELPVEADRVQLQQVLLNLVTNAFEAMEGVGEAILRISARDIDARSAEVAVRDNGRGIGDQTAEDIFEAFHTTRSEGLGLGLAISRSIVEAHGGRLWASENEGAGLTFRFTIPLASEGDDTPRP